MDDRLGGSTATTMGAGAAMDGLLLEQKVRKGSDWFVSISKRVN